MESRDPTKSPDPPRLKDGGLDASDELRGALTDAANAAPRPEARGRIAAALGLPLGTGVGTGSGGPDGAAGPSAPGAASAAAQGGGAGTAATGVASGKALGAIIGGVALVGGAIGIALSPANVEPDPSPSPSPAAVVTTQAEQKSPGAQRNVIPLEDLAVAPKEARVDERDDPVPKPARAKAPTASGTKSASGARATIQPERSSANDVAPAAEREASPGPSTGDEAALLARAHAALSSNPARALELAREHERRFPTGSLAQEREVLVIEALERLGQSNSARERANSFKQRYPGSALERRVDTRSR